MKRVAVFPILVVAGLVAGCGTVVSATREFAFTQPWENYTRVAVKVRNGAIELRTAAGEQIRISGTKRVGGITLAEAEQNLDRLTLTAGGDASDPDTFVVELQVPEDLRNKSAGANLLIEVPKPCAARLVTSNGTIRVQDMSGEVVAESSNGSIYVKDVTGTVRAETSNGRIDLKQVAGDVDAASSNGSIVADGVGGACVLRTSNGDIRLISGSSAADRLEMRTSNGGIHATLPSALAAELKLVTSNGRVRVSLPEAAMKMVEAARSRFSAVLNGGGGLVVAETSNGSITVDAR